jgi:hypothetical protein
MLYNRLVILLDWLQLPPFSTSNPRLTSVIVIPLTV